MARRIGSHPRSHRLLALPKLKVRKLGLKGKGRRSRRSAAF